MFAQIEDFKMLTLQMSLNEQNPAYTLKELVCKVKVSSCRDWMVRTCTNLRAQCLHLNSALKVEDITILLVGSKPTLFIQMMQHNYSTRGPGTRFSLCQQGKEVVTKWKQVETTSKSTILTGYNLAILSHNQELQTKMNRCAAQENTMNTKLRK